jgi:hypothetical protein
VQVVTAAAAEAREAQALVLIQELLVVILAVAEVVPVLYTMTIQVFPVVAERLGKAETAQSASSGAQDALSHQPIQETYNERNSD